MQFGYLKRLAEVQQKLGPMLQELGLKAKLTERMGTRVISFEDHEGEFASPVEIEFASTALTNDDVGDWNGSTMVAYYYTTIEMGKAGWKHDLWGKGARYEEFDENYEETFETITEALLEMPLIYIGEGLPAYTRNEEFAMAFLFLEGVAAEQNLVMDCERHDGVETIVIEDAQLNVWYLAIKGRDATLCFNGELMQTITSQNGMQIAETVAASILAAETRLRL